MGNFKSQIPIAKFLKIRLHLVYCSLTKLFSARSGSAIGYIVLRSGLICWLARYPQTADRPSF
ncbi:MAG: hypothetical protein WBA89_24760 [Microcoleus sp.]|uniref:hypothetical protein n=1 Tax=Microcoleus sp. TaxID=44472 RepID=UPI003C781CD0